MTAIVIAPHGLNSPLAEVVAELGAAGVPVHEVADVAAIDGKWRAPAIILDLCDASYEPEAVAATIDRVVATVPDALPIAVAIDADLTFVMTCLRTR